MGERSDTANKLQQQYRSLQLAKRLLRFAMLRSCDIWRQSSGTQMCGLRLSDVWHQFLSRHPDDKGKHSRRTVCFARTDTRTKHIYRELSSGQWNIKATLPDKSLSLLLMHSDIKATHQDKLCSASAHVFPAKLSHAVSLLGSHIISRHA